MPRAFVVHPSNEWYGADQMLWVWARVLRDSGWQVEVALPTDVDYDGELGRRLADLGCDVREWDLPILRRRDLTPKRIWRLIARVLKSWIAVRKAARDADAVLFSTAATALSMPAVMGLRARRAVHVQESFREGLQARVLSRLLAFTCDDIIGCSGAVRDAMVGAARAKCEVLPNGIEDVEPLGLAKAQPPVILLVARIQSWKGQDMAIRMLADPALRLHESQPVLDLVGAEPPGEEGVYIPALRELATKLGVADRVHFLGQRSDVRELVSRASVVLNVSQRPDPFPLSTLEAMREGAAIVAGRLGGLPEMLADAGALADPHSEGALAAEAATLLSDVGSARLLGGRARARWETNYSAVVHETRLRALFARWASAAEGLGS
jgi:glycosyltransferase involved in cell wall biosynthesis